MFGAKWFGIGLPITHQGARSMAVCHGNFMPRTCPLAKLLLLHVHHPEQVPSWGDLILKGQESKMQVICSWKCFGWYNNDPSLEVMLVHAWLYHETLWYFRVFYCMVMSFRPRCQVRRRNSLWKRSCAESAHDRWIQAPHHADVYCIMQYRAEYY